MSKDEKLGTLEALCANESIQTVCVDWLGMVSQSILEDTGLETHASAYAHEIRKIYAMPDAIASEQIHDSDIIDRFIGDIYEQYLPGLEERVKEAREELSRFIRDELGGRCLLNVQESHSYDEINPPETLRGELEECGVNVHVADAVFSLTEKGKEALER